MRITKFKSVIWMIVLLVILALSIPYAWHLLKVIFASGNLWGQLEMFQWATIGFVIFAIVRRFLKGNLDMAQVFSHEFTHLVTAGVVSGELYEMHVYRDHGYVMTAHHKDMAMPVSLAPYCFPVFTIMLLSFRWMLDFHGMWLFDIVVGASLAFHIGCFKAQIGNYQTDIKSYPLALSYTYIVTMWLLMFCLIIPCFFPNMNGHGTGNVAYSYGLFSSLCRLFVEWWHNLCAILSSIF